MGSNIPFSILLGISLGLLPPLHFFGQERVFLDLDAYSCRVGDTVWFKGTVTRDLRPSGLSTVLYVELCKSSGAPVYRKAFPVFRGHCLGNLVLGDTLPGGTYYVVAFTRCQLNYGPLDAATCFTVPLYVLDTGTPDKLPGKKHSFNNPSLASAKIGDVFWASNLLENKLSSLLETDSGGRRRHFTIAEPLRKDSAFQADVETGPAASHRYMMFPLDSLAGMHTLLLYEDSVLLARQHINTAVPGREDTLKTALRRSMGDSLFLLVVALPDSVDYYTTISIQDAGRSIASPWSVLSLGESYTEDLTVPLLEADTGYISFAGKASTTLGKAIRDGSSREIFMAAVTDSGYLFSRLFAVDGHGGFILDSLVFFDSTAFVYQINKPEDGHTKDVRLQLSTNLGSFRWPVVDSALLAASWEDGDSLVWQGMDALYTGAERRAREVSTMKLLQPAVVRAWKSPRKELDGRYTTGPFSEPSLYSYDLRTDSSEYNRDLFWFINTHPECGLSYDPVGDTLRQVNDHPVHYFVDEVEYDAHSLRMFDFDRMAYVKVLESDFLSTQRPSFSLAGAGQRPPARIGQPSGGSLHLPVQKTAVNLLVYMRKGNDFRTMRGGLNTMRVKGFDRLIPYRANGRSLYWDPIQIRKGTFTVSFAAPTGCRTVRVRVSGISPAGKIVFCERVLPVQ